MAEKQLMNCDPEANAKGPKGHAWLAEKCCIRVQGRPTVLPCLQGVAFPSGPWRHRGLEASSTRLPPKPSICGKHRTRWGNRPLRYISGAQTGSSAALPKHCATSLKSTASNYIHLCILLHFCEDISESRSQHYAREFNFACGNPEYSEKKTGCCHDWCERNGST